MPCFPDDHVPVVPIIPRSRAPLTSAIDRAPRIGVVVPARNEETHIGECLAALDLAARVARVPLDIAVVLDSCTDGTARAVSAAARELGSRVHAVKVDARCVGTARKVGAAALLDVMGLDPFAGASGWLATTDADSLVPPDWFVRQMGYRSGGADLVVGTVHVVDWQDRSRLRPHWERAYAADHHPRAPGHRHVHGANLSFSAAAYLRAGGFADLASDEDVRLVQACRSAGASVIWASDLSVATSARRIGRAPLGFAWYLNQLAHTVDATLPNLELA